MTDITRPTTLVIAAAVIRRGEDVLLVHQHRHQDDRPTWALPGGKAEEGETILDALVREVKEETGLTVKEIGAILSVTHTVDRGAHHQYIAFIVEVKSWEGSLQPADPDDVILEAVFVPQDEALLRLQTLPWSDMRDPSIAAVRGEQPLGSLRTYKEEGDRQTLLSAPQAVTKKS